MNIAYVRVSAADQNEDRQRCSLEPYHIERWYIEKASGKDTNRPQLKEMLDFVREGDTIYISEFSRLGRSTRDLLDIIDFLQAKKVNLVSQKENLDCNSPSGRLQLTMLAAISEFEREMILERQREGIKIAKEKGKYKGRKRIDVPDIDKHYYDYMTRKTSKSALAKELGISRNTLDRLFEEYLNQQREQGLVNTSVPMDGQQSL